MNRPSAPIGIFDSGVGGLTVLKEIRRQLPGEPLVYLGDTARTPYGSKASETVTRFTLQCVAHLRRFKIKALVIACNTASAYALSHLRRHLDIPVLGVIDPGARAALAVAGKKTIGVIGTRATVLSGAYTRAITRIEPGRRVVSAPCPLLVPLVEEGWLDHAVTHTVVETYLKPWQRRSLGALILGCTHYPVLKPVFRRICGPAVRLIDSAEVVARELRQTLKAQGLLANARTSRAAKLLVTDVPDAFVRVARHILGQEISGVRRITLTEDDPHV